MQTSKMADNIEMKGLGPEQGGGGGGGDVGVTKMAAAAGGPAEGHVHPFLDLPGVVGADGGEPDVEKGQPAATTTAGVEEERNQYDVSPLTVPDTVTTTTTTGAADSTHATAASTVNHKATTKHRLVSRLRSLANNKVFLAATLVIVALLAATIALAVIVSKGTYILSPRCTLVTLVAHSQLLCQTPTSSIPSATTTRSVSTPTSTVSRASLTTTTPWPSTASLLSTSTLTRPLRLTT